MTDDALDGGGAAIDLIEHLGMRDVREERVIVRVIADEMPRVGRLLQHLARGDRTITVAVEIAPDHEERGVNLVLREQIEDAASSPERPVVERQRDELAMLARLAMRTVRDAPGLRDARLLVEPRPRGRSAFGSSAIVEPAVLWRRARGRRQRRCARQDGDDRLRARAGGRA